MLESVLRSITRDGYHPVQEHQEELFLLAVVLENPALRFYDYLKAVDRRISTGRAQVQVRDTLQRWRLDYTARREEWAADVQVVAEKLGAFARDLRPETRAELVALEVHLDQDSWPKITYRAILHLLGERLRAEMGGGLYADWCYWLANSRESEAKRACFNLLRALQKVAGAAMAAQPGRDPLLDEVEDLRTALEQKHRECEALQREFEHEREELAREVLRNFLRDMNGVEADCILDRIVAAEQLLKRLNNEGYAFPGELDTLKVLPRLLHKFLKKLQVLPVAKVGDCLALTLEESTEYDYKGSEFTDIAESKRVRVVTPGWRYGQALISLPCVREVEMAEEVEA